MFMQAHAYSVSPSYKVKRYFDLICQSFYGRTLYSTGGCVINFIAADITPM